MWSFEKNKRKRVGQPPKYHHLFHNLKDTIIYNAPAIVEHGDQSGLFELETNKSAAKDTATATIRSYLNRTLDEPPDGICTFPGSGGRPGWYGWRLKELIQREDPLSFKLLKRKLQYHFYLVFSQVQTKRPILIMILLCFLMLPLLALWIAQRSAPIEVIHDLTDHPSEAHLERLRSLLLKPEFQQFQPLIIGRIAEMETQLRVNISVVKSIDKVIAVFAIQPPSVLFEGNISVQLGDLLTLERIHGYVCEITQEQITLETTHGTSTLKFPDFQLFNNPHFRPSAITVYPAQGNLDLVLKAACTLANVRLEGQPRKPANLIGFFDQTSYEDFLKEIDHKIGATFDPGTRTLSLDPKTNLRSYIGFTPFFSKIRPIRLDELLSAYGHYLGYQIELDLTGELNEASLIVQSPSQLQDLLADLDLDMTFNEITGVIKVSNRR